MRASSMPNHHRDHVPRDFSSSHNGSTSRSRSVDASQRRTAAEVHRVFREFADGTSMHGVPKIINARSLVGRVFWSIICFCAFFMFMWQTSYLLQRYYSYPKKVNMEILQRPIPFPAVTVCNTGHLDLLVVKSIVQELAVVPESKNSTSANSTENGADYDDLTEEEMMELMAQYEQYEQYEMDGEGGSIDTSSPDSECTVKNKNCTNHEKFMYAYNEFFQSSSIFMPKYYEFKSEKNRQQAEAQEGMWEVYSRLGLSANVGPEIASYGGITKEDFIINCRFMDERCNVTEDFYTVFDPYYFNCFTFKSNLFQAKAARLQGVEYGLSLLLFSATAGQPPTDKISEHEYLLPGIESDPALVTGKGSRVVIHAPGTRPYPTGGGFEIPPGFSANIGVKARENIRIGPPHGNCSNLETLESKGRKHNSKYKYTLMSCQNECLQNEILKHCGCLDNRIMSEHNVTLDTKFCLKLPRLNIECLMGNQTSEECSKEVERWDNRTECRREVYENMTIRNPDNMDDCTCNPPCEDTVYDAAYSLATLPDQKDDTAFYFLINDFLETRLAPEKRKVMEDKYGKDKYKSEVSKFVSRLNVHIADNNVIKTEESPDYEAIRLVSDIGGQLGLWIGISVMTLFEVLQLIADVLRYLTTRTRTLGERNKSDKVSDRLRIPEREVEMVCEIDKLTAV